MPKNLPEHYLEADRETFRRNAALRGLTRRAQYRYPDEFAHEPPDFVEWLTQYTTQLVNAHGSGNVDIHLLRLSSLPLKEAESYQQMWAYGNHYRVANEGDRVGFVTQDYALPISLERKKDGVQV